MYQKTAGLRSFSGHAGVVIVAAWAVVTAFQASWAQQDNSAGGQPSSASAAPAKAQEEKPAAEAPKTAAPQEGQPAAGQPQVQVKEKKNRGTKDKTTTERLPKPDRPAGTAAGGTQAGPLSDKVKAVVDGGTTFDFGEIWVGPALQHAFKIKNEGTEPLEIRGVKPACGCTAAGEHPKVIKPGETGEFPFSLKSEGLHEKFSKSISITTNEQDKANNPLKLTLTGIAKQYVEVAPGSVSFGSLKSNDSIEKTVTLKCNRETPMELTLAEPDKNMPFKYDLVEKEKGKVYELRVSTTPPVKEGTHNSEILLTTNIPEKKEVKIRVSAVVPPRLAVRPAAIIFNPRLASYPVKFTNNGEKLVNVTSVSVDNEAIKAQISEKTGDNIPGKLCTIQVMMPENFEIPDKQEYALTLRTDDPDQPEIKVPIKAAPKPEPRPQEKLVGKPVPSFTVTTVDGKAVSSETLKDEKGPVVLNFWAGDCGFCKLQIPRLEKVREAYSGKNVRFIDVAQKRSKAYSEDEIKELAKTLNVGSELAIDLENKSGKEFKVNSYPSLFVLGLSGNVEHCILGNSGTLEGDLKKKLDQLLGISTTVSAPPTVDGKAQPAAEQKPGVNTKATDAKAAATAATTTKPEEAKTNPDAKASP